jgi:hypothetical protein
MECTDCHQYALTHARATIPNIEVCELCHSGEPLTESPEEARLLEFIEAGEKVPWRKVYRLEDHVYFSHRRHTALAGLDCAVCHGEVGERTEPVGKPAKEISMDRCIECHRENEVTTDCMMCHR